MEIERKFLITDMNIELEALTKQSKVETIEQGYVATEPNEVRVRKVVCNYSCFDVTGYFLTVKSKGTLKRKEIETHIDCKQYKEMLSICDDVIRKTRYSIGYEGYVIELDVYSGDLKGLITAEIEFKSEDEAKQFNPPSWLGIEVTEDLRYKNKNLLKYRGEILCK